MASPFADSQAPMPGPGGAVVLVHGFVCNRGFWLPWLRALRDRGLAYATVNLEPVFGSNYSVLVERDGRVREVVVDGQTGQARPDNNNQRRRPN